MTGENNRKTAIELVNVHKSFGPQPILRGVDLLVEIVEQRIPGVGQVTVSERKSMRSKASSSIQPEDSTAPRRENQ